MFILFIIIAVLMLFFPTVKYSKNIHEDYASAEKTLPIKGVFVILVFCSHFAQYASFSSSLLNAAYSKILLLFGQLMVAMFLFYSGYGIYESIKSKKDYAKTFAKKRLLPTYINFALCLLLFLAAAFITKTSYSVKTILLSFTGWDSIGNSNWYMFVIFILYIGIILCFNLFKNSKETALIAFTIYSLLFVLFLRKTRFNWWYDTLLCFCFGMWFSYFKDSIDKLMKNNALYYPVLCILFAAFMLTRKMSAHNHIFYCAFSIIFSCIIVLLTMKLQFGNRIISFFGEHVFSIYMLQRLPMILLKNVINNAYLYFFICLAATLVLSVIMEKVFKKIHDLIMN